MRAVDLGPNPGGICMCGCGREAPLARRTHRQFGHVKDTPQRFIRGHAANASRRAMHGHAYWVEEPGPLDTPCHAWQGAVNSKGYPIRGVIGEGRNELVHRQHLAQRLGRPIRDGHQAHHRCENKRCVNGEHLDELTPKQHKAHHPNRRAVTA